MPMFWNLWFSVQPRCSAANPIKKALLGKAKTSIRILNEKLSHGLGSKYCRECNREVFWMLHFITRVYDLSNLSRNITKPLNCNADRKVITARHEETTKYFSCSSCFKVAVDMDYRQKHKCYLPSPTVCSPLNPSSIPTSKAAHWYFRKNLFSLQPVSNKKSCCVPLQLLLCVCSYTCHRPLGDRIMRHCFCEAVLSNDAKKDCCTQKWKRKIIC